LPQTERCVGDGARISRIKKKVREEGTGAKSSRMLRNKSATVPESPAVKITKISWRTENMTKDANKRGKKEGKEKNESQENEKCVSFWGLKRRLGKGGMTHQTEAVRSKEGGGQ